MVRVCRNLKLPPVEAFDAALGCLIASIPHESSGGLQLVRLEKHLRRACAHCLELSCRANRIKRANSMPCAYLFSRYLQLESTVGS